MDTSIVPPLLGLEILLVLSPETVSGSSSEPHCRAVAAPSLFASFNHVCLHKTFA